MLMMWTGTCYKENTEAFSSKTNWQTQAYGRIILKWIFFGGWDWRGGMDWIDVAQNTDRWQAFVNMVMNLQVL